MKLSIIILVYNEQRTINEVIDRVLARRPLAPSARGHRRQRRVVGRDAAGARGTRLVEESVRQGSWKTRSIPGKAQPCVTVSRWRPEMSCSCRTPTSS